jgi:hypothetical protein
MSLLFSVQAIAAAVVYKDVPLADKPKELASSKIKRLPSFCERPESAIIKSVKITENAEFFFRPFPISDRITYSANSHNYMLDLKTGKQSLLPGRYDGFPSPDEKFLIVAQGNEGIKIFNINQTEKPVFEDKARTGYYQSCGVQKNSAGQNIYRIMLDNTSGGYSIKDYKSDKNGQIEAVQSAAVPLCGNMKSLSLPMLSKDGNFLAAFNAQDQVTQIFKIDPKSGSCRMTRSLGVNAGKVDFSFDGKSVTYAHIAVSSFNTKDGDTARWMRSPRSDMVANIYTQNLETGETRAITHFTRSNVLYPSFNAKGEILARKFDKDGTEFLKLNPNIIADKKKKIDLSKIACENMDKNTKAALGLGAIFLNYCDQNRENWEPDGIILLGRELTSKQCQSLLTKWAKEESLEALTFLKGSLARKNLDPQVLKDISRSDLAAACGK